MTDKSNPHSDKTTEERKADELALSEQAAKEAAAVAAQEALEAANKAAEETSKDLPKEEEGTNQEGEEEEKSDDTPLDTDTFGDTNSAVGNSVLQLMQNAGATPEEARSLLFEAVMKNDMSLIDRDALTEKVGAAKAEIILAGTKTFASERAEKQEALNKTVTKVAGNMENWTKVQGWADDALSDTDKADFNDMLSSGGIKAQFAAQELMKRYNADSKNTTIETDNPRVDGDVDTDTGSEAITAKEYFRRMEAANRKGDTAAINAAKAARARGRKQGL